jgi:hypothetical protein
MVVRGELERRLTELRSEFEAGRRLEADLQARLSEVSQTVLRLSGAIQVLEELLSADGSRNGAPADTAVEVPSSA